jgi:hypothetical protein
MTVELRPETEELVLKELERGQFHSIEEVITHAIRALHDVSEVEAQAVAKQSLGQFLLESPLRHSALKFDRNQDYPRLIQL